MYIQEDTGIPGDFPGKTQDVFTGKTPDVFPGKTPGIFSEKIPGFPGGRTCTVFPYLCGKQNGKRNGNETPNLKI
jgi:hypothetical protein